MPVVMIISLKGGVAKTATTVALAEFAASQGKKTLVIDADHQCMSSELLLGHERFCELNAKEATLYHLLKSLLEEDADPSAIHSFFTTNPASDIGGGLDALSIIPCSLMMTDIQENVAKAKRGYQTNKFFLQHWNKCRKRIKQSLKEYDYVFIDCPPYVFLQVQFFLGLADCYITPCIPDRLSILGAQHLQQSIKKKGLKIPALGLLWSMCKGTHTHQNLIKDGASANRKGIPWGNLPTPFVTQIPLTDSFTRTTQPDQAPTTFSKKYGSALKSAYAALWKEIEQRTSKADDQ